MGTTWNKLARSLWTRLAAVVVLAASPAAAANIGFIVDADAILDMPFDQFWVDRLQSQGHTVEPIGDMDLPSTYPAVDLFIISTDVNSTELDPVEWPEETRPIIVYEDALYDELLMSAAGGRDQETSIDIEKPDHPLAAGLSGTVQIYDAVQGITHIGDPWADGIEVIATIFGVPAISVLEAGQDDMNGQPAAGQRISIFSQDIGNGDLYTDAGLALLDASVNYALGIGLGRPPQLQAGDADQDLDFDQLDLVRVQIAAKYLTGRAATWGEGDWNAAPGGAKGSPPPGNGFFDQLDIIAALSHGKYLRGPYAAVRPGGVVGDNQTSVVYNPANGELSVDAPSGTQLTSINIDSAARIFTGNPAQNLGGSFDNDADNNIFKATFGSSFGSLTFGNVAQAGLSQPFVLNDLTVVGSLAGGGALGQVDLVYIPEPAANVLAALGVLLAAAAWSRGVVVDRPFS
jgi:hypothetical protein